MTAAAYRMMALLRRGNDFETYDAWSNHRHARCVIKTIRADRRGRDNRARLRQEGTLLTTLDHPHLVRGYEVLTRPRLAVVMETLTGSTLSHVLDRRRLSVRDIGHLGMQISSALHYLHRHSVLHLDVKPGNIIVDGGRARLYDLSLAQRPGRVAAGLGTEGYLSPEQAAGRSVDSAADVWGLGLTLYVAALGSNPFRGGTEPSGTGAASPHQAPPVATLRRLPRDLATLLDAALAPSPVNRPTMPEMINTCAEVAGLGAMLGGRTS